MLALPLVVIAFCMYGGESALQVIAKLEIQVCIGNSRLNSCKHAAGCSLTFGHVCNHRHADSCFYIAFIQAAIRVGVTVHAVMCGFNCVCECVNV